MPILQPYSTDLPFDPGRALAQRGIVLVALSPQTPDGSLTMQEKHDLDFAVLSDPSDRIPGALGLLTHPSDTARERDSRIGSVAGRSMPIGPSRCRYRQSRSFAATADLRGLTSRRFLTRADPPAESSMRSTTSNSQRRIRRRTA